MVLKSFMKVFLCWCCWFSWCSEAIRAALIDRRKKASLVPRNAQGHVVRCANYGHTERCANYGHAERCANYGHAERCANYGHAERCANYGHAEHCANYCPFYRSARSTRPFLACLTSSTSTVTTNCPLCLRRVRWCSGRPSSGRALLPSRGNANRRIMKCETHVRWKKFYLAL